MVKKIYYYHDGVQIALSHDKPEHGIPYIEKTIGIIGVPDVRVITIKTSDGTLLYNDIEHIPIDDNLIEQYLLEVNKNGNAKNN